MRVMNETERRASAKEVSDVGGGLSLCVKRSRKSKHITQQIHACCLISAARSTAIPVQRRLLLFQLQCMKGAYSAIPQGEAAAVRDAP